MSPLSAEPSPIAMESSSVERMLQATRPAALTGRTMSAATRRIPTTRIESAIVTAASAARATLSGPIGTPATRAPSSSMMIAANAR